MEKTHMEMLKDRRSSVELLPDEAIPAMQEAYDALLAKRSHQIDVRDVFNQRLAQLSLNGIAKSTFSRWAQKVRSGRIKRPVRMTGRVTETTGMVSISAETATLILAAAEAITRDINK